MISGYVLLDILPVSFMIEAFGFIFYSVTDGFSSVAFILFQMYCNVLFLSFFIVWLFLLILFPLLQKWDHPFLFGIQVILCNLNLNN